MADSFFSLGGHSLLVTKLILKIRDEYHVVLTPHQIYTAGTLQGVADLIDHNIKIQSLSKEHLLVPHIYTQTANKYQLSSFQLSIYFAHLVDNKAYTVPVFIKIDRSLDIIRAREAFISLQNKYKVLSGHIDQSDNGIFHFLPKDVSSPIIEQVAKKDISNHLNQLSAKVFNGTVAI